MLPGGREVAATPVELGHGLRLQSMGSGMIQQFRSATVGGARRRCSRPGKGNGKRLLFAAEVDQLVHIMNIPHQMPGKDSALPEQLAVPTRPPGQGVHFPAKSLDFLLGTVDQRVEGSDVKHRIHPARHLPQTAVLPGKSLQHPPTALRVTTDQGPEHLAPCFFEQMTGRATRIRPLFRHGKIDPLMLAQLVHQLQAGLPGWPRRQAMQGPATVAPTATGGWQACRVAGEGRQRRRWRKKGGSRHGYFRNSQKSKETTRLTRIELVKGK